MKVILDDGTIFVIDEDLASNELIDKFVRIMKYMTFSDNVIANGLMENLYNLALENNTVQTQLKEFINEVKNELQE